MKLSICIPTYNFAEFIGDTLDSIINNHCDGVEILILDGGSTDNTASVVSNKQKTCAEVKYYNQGFRGGIDKDIATLVSMAKGEYCWLFSADDIMKPGAISTVLKNLASNCDVYLCEHTLCDSKLLAMKEYPVFEDKFGPGTFQLRDPIQRSSYFKAAITTEAFYSYLSGPIFRKEVWTKADKIPDTFYGTCWALAGRLLSLIPTGLVVYYMKESLISKRSGVDSFMEHGIVNRMRITIEGFEHIAETIFGLNSVEYFHIRRVIRNEDAFHLRRLVSVKIMVANCKSGKEDLNVLNTLVYKNYANSGFFNLMKYFIYMYSPVSVLIWAKKLKNLAST